MKNLQSLYVFQLICAADLLHRVAAGVVATIALQFAELTKIEGVEATRPVPDEIHVHFSSAPSRELLAEIAAVFAGRTERAIDIAGAGETALDVGEALIDLGMPASSLESQRDDDVEGVVLRIRYAA